MTKENKCINCLKETNGSIRCNTCEKVFGEQLVKESKRSKGTSDGLYGCDKCGKRILINEEAFWVTSTYGLCNLCDSKITEYERKQLRREYE